MVTIKPNPKRIWLMGFAMSAAIFLSWSLLGLTRQFITNEFDANFWKSLLIAYPFGVAGGCLLLTYLLRNRWVIVMTPDKIIGDSGLKVTEIEFAKVSQVSNQVSRWKSSYKIISESGQMIPIHFTISDEDCQLIFDTIAKKRD